MNVPEIMHQPFLSVLVPSRQRAEELKFSLDSLGIERNNLDVLIWVDDDDPELADYQKLFSNQSHIKLFIKPRVGYLGFHQMLNFLASEALGDCFILWNDDAYMESPDWYDIFIEYATLANLREEPVVYNTWGAGRQYNLFPCVSRKYFELLGHIAQNCVCDNWIKAVADSAHIQRSIFGIRPRHRKFGMDNDKLGDLKDTTYDSVMDLFTHSRFLGSRNVSAFRRREADENTIQNWIKQSNDRNVRVGFVGLGKLGFPMAVAIESRGKNIVAYDINPEVQTYIQKKTFPHQEQQIEKLLKFTKIDMVNSVADVVTKCNIIFCAVQTPHDTRFEGDKPLKEKPVDFDYSHLKKAIKEIVAAADTLEEKTTLVVVSTCLPGTYEKEIKPLLSPKINYVYNPSFIAMGTVIPDFLSPEFALIGTDTGDATPLTQLYKIILGQNKAFITDITTAEGIKMFYNTFITTKTVLGNLYGEIAHKLGMNVDHIHEAFSKATNRLISPKYLRSGVGDGGACHPRDNIALSFLARKLKLSFNFFDALITAREDHMTWLADLFIAQMKANKLPGIILGKSFKPETNIQTGSAAILLTNILKQKKVNIAQYEFDYPPQFPQGVYFIATQHIQYTKLQFPNGSIIIDPFRYIPQRDEIQVIAIGKKEVTKEI